MERRRWLVAVVVVVVAAAGIWTVTRKVRAGGERRRLQALVVAMHEARASVDSCRTALAEEQTDFRAFDRAVDSLRQQLSEYESSAGRVPAEVYDAYLTAFEEYNARIPDWQARADSLRAHWSGCSELTRRHNLIVDTVRTRTRGSVSSDSG